MAKLAPPGNNENPCTGGRPLAAPFQRRMNLIL
jgi:hypothetical protein